MGKVYLTICTVALTFLLLPTALFGQAPQGQEELINGYKASDFYYNTVEIPAEVLTSNRQEDRINVVLHHKIIAYEQGAQRPLKSLQKDEMEDLLALWQAEALEELGLNTPQPDPATGQPADKPAIIHEGDQD